MSSQHWFPSPIALLIAGSQGIRHLRPDEKG